MTSISWKNHALSQMCLGTAQLGMEYGINNKTGKPSVEDSKRILAKAYELGVNTFDTAFGYGSSQQLITDYFKVKNTNANIISKVSSKDIANIEEKIGSLPKDLFCLLLHDPRLLLEIDDSLRSKLNNLKLHGKVKYFGVSIYSDQEFKKALEYDFIDVIQVPFNIFDHRAKVNRWIDLAKQSDILIMARSIYLQGLFFMDSSMLPGNLGKHKAYIDQLKEVSLDFGVSIQQLAYSFVKTNAPDCIHIIGCETVEQLGENVEIIEKSILLNDSQMLLIEELFSFMPENLINPSKWCKD